VRRGVRAPRSHTPNSSDSSDTTPEAGGRSPPDTLERPGSEAVSCQQRGHAGDLRPKSIEACSVRVSLRTKQQVGRHREWNQVLSRELAQAALESVAFDRTEPEFGYHERDAHVAERGIEPLHVQQSNAEPLSRAQEALDITATRDPSGSRETELQLRRRRTCWGAEPSGACGPSSADDSGPRDPTSSPCADGSRAS
jgi:hypothetical protein